MAGKKNKQTNTGNRQQPVAEKQEQVKLQHAPKPANTGFIQRYSNVLVPAAIAIITWLFLKVCLNNGFTDWDDIAYITNDPLIKDISPEGLKHIFSSPVQGNYHPLTILSYAIEYSYVHLQPWLYHFDSLLFHIAVTMLVYWLVNLLTGRRVAAAVTALLFGLHPMHMESVAWLSGRKDVVYGLFYVAACIAWVYYIRAVGDKKWRWYTGVIVLFICSLLAKPVAVVLPLTLLLIDYFEKRKWNYSLLLEKIPHFVIAIGFGLRSVSDQHDYGAMDTLGVTYNIMDRFLFGSYALVTYLWKAIAPVNLCCFYPYPDKVGGSLPSALFIYPVLVAAIVFTVWTFGRRNRVVVFGSLFFLINIALLLQFIPVGMAIIAERYSYIPYMGLFFMIGWLVSGYFEPGTNRQTGYVVLGTCLAYSLFMGYLADERCQVWYSSNSLWSDEVQKQPDIPVGYMHLGSDYFDKYNTATNLNEKKRYFDSSYALLTKAISYQVGYGNPYFILGELYRTTGRVAEAKQSFYRGMALKKTDNDYAKAYLALGLIYIGQNNDSAGYCFRASVRIKPDFPEAHSHFAYFYDLAGKHDSSLTEYGIAIAQNPGLFEPYVNRGMELQRLHRCGEAMKDFEKAVAINPDNGQLYYARSFCYSENGDKVLALKDVQKALSLGYTQVDNNYYQGLHQ